MDDLSEGLELVLNISDKSRHKKLRDPEVHGEKRELRKGSLKKEGTVVQKDHRVHSRSPVVPDGKGSKGDIFSSRFAQNEQAVEKGMPDNDYISEKGPYEEQRVFPVKPDGEQGSKQESILSEEDCPRGLDGKIQRTGKRKSGEKTFSKPESLSKSSPSISIKKCAMRKPYYILLEDINHGEKAKDIYCLKALNAKERPSKVCPDKGAVLKKLRSILHNVLDESSTRNSQKPLQIRNNDGPLEKTKRDESQRDSELKNPVKQLNNVHSETAEGNVEPNSPVKVQYSDTDHDAEKHGRGTSSPDITALCEQGVFARFSFMDSDCDSSVIDLCEIQEDAKAIERKQGDPVRVSEASRLKATSFKPPKMFIDYGSKLIKQVLEEHTSHKGEKFPKALAFSKEALREDVGQPCGINLFPVSRRKTFHTNKTDSPHLAKTLVSKDKFPNVPPKRTVASRLPDKGLKAMSPRRTKTTASLGKRMAPNRNVSNENRKEVEELEMELSGPRVKLLGSRIASRDNFRLGRAIEVEDFSNNKGSQGSIVTLSPGRRKKRQLDSANKCLNIEDSNAKKRSQRLNVSAAPTQLTEEQSRLKVADALNETLQKRLEASPEMTLPGKVVSKIARQVERELFRLSCCVDHHYRSKYRSLLFNLRSPENQPLFQKVILGEITPKRLVQMTSLEMAPKELVEWRAKENKRVLEIIQKEERQAPRRCSSKFTHKGIIEIDRDTEEDLTAKEMFETQSSESKSVSERLMELERDPGEPLDCFKSPGKVTHDCKAGLKSPSNKRNFCQKTKPMFSEVEGKALQEDSTGPALLPKKRRVEEPSWIGFIRMFSMKQFWAKAYSVSGSGDQLCQEMGVIRFQPSLSWGSSPYNMLYTYLNNKQRYGMVESLDMEVFVVPLAAYQPVPSKLRPLSGPGLDPSHPSLLLGLLLPKRTSQFAIEAMVSFSPNAERKVVRFSDSPQTKHLDLPAAPHPLAALPKGGLTSQENQVATLVPQGDPVPLDVLLGHTEELCREMFQRDLHPINLEGPCDGAPPATFEAPPLIGPPCPAGDQVPLCMDSDLSQLWNILGLHLGPEQYGTCSVPAPDFFSDPLFAGVLPPCDAPLVPPPAVCPGSVAGESGSLLDGTLSLIDQLQTCIQSQEPQPAAFSLPVVPPEITSTLSQAAAGLDFSLSQVEDGTFAHLQQLLVTLSGQIPPPSAL